MVKNLTAIPITTNKGIKVTQGVAVNAVPQMEVAAGTLKKLDEMQVIQWTRMLVEWRREVLFQQLDLSGLEGWSDENQAAACALLAEYHNIFSLEPGELDCTDLVKHEIRVVDYKPFKERFQRIPPTKEDEVWAHMKEMLEEGAIHPSQSPWCNAVVLVQGKMEVYAFALTFINWMLEPRKTPIHFSRYKKPLRAWLVQGTSPPWTWKQVFGRLQWMRCWSNTLLSWWGT